MTVNELKKALYAIVSEYFANTEVKWSEQRKSVKPSNTFISLKLSNLERELHYINVINTDVPIDYQPSRMQFTVQLFTHGGEETVEDEEGSYTISVNTALADIMDFEKYLMSDYGIGLCNQYDIAIRPDGAAQDISAVTDTVYEYRAIQNYIVDFMQTSKGMAGIARDNWRQTASGGGTSELAEMENGYIEDADITKNFE